MMKRMFKRHWRWFYHKEGWMYYGYAMTIVTFPLIWYFMTIIGVMVFYPVLGYFGCERP